MRLESKPKFSRLGVLDIGSNSVRFVIYELFGASFTPVFNEKVLAGLGRDLRQTGRLNEAGRDMALEALRRFSMLTKAQNLDQVLIGATAALREAEDADEFLARVEAETGFNIKPVSGPEEARLTAMGVLAAEFRADGTAADLGGASLELIHIENETPAPGVSYPVGPFQILEDIVTISDSNRDEIKRRVDVFLDAKPFDVQPDKPLYLVGGAWRNLGIIHQKRSAYPLRTLQGYTLDPDDAIELGLWASGEGRDEVLDWPGITKRRCETLPYAGLLLAHLIKRLKPSLIVISATGLREGLIQDSMPEALRKRDALLDGCRDLARGNLQQVHFAEPLFNFLGGISERFPASFEPHNETRLRRAACSLAGIGKGLHPDYRADLVFENVFYAPLSDLTHKERAYLALILFSSYTAGAKTPNKAAIDLLLSPGEQRAARIYGFAIRFAIVVSGRSADLLQYFRVGWAEDKVELIVDEIHAALITERVNLRLEKLHTLIDSTA